MKSCYLIKIPFSTKGERNKKENKLKIVGYANYVYDFEKGEVIHEYLELTKANYRLTDKRITKPTDYYKQEAPRRFRDNILDPITNHISEDITEITFNNLNQQELKKINKYLKLESTTVKNQFAYFQGSNISGAVLNPKASPLVCMEQEYFDCNFSNPMKKIWGKQCLSYNILKIISLVDLISDNKIFCEYFKESNAWYFNDRLVNHLEDISNYIKGENKNNIDSWVYPVDLDEKIANYLDNYMDNIWEKNNLNAHKQILRSFYSSGIKKELNNGTIPFCASNLKFDSVVIENAHIVSFARLVNLNTKESILKAISPFNVLRINSDNHKLFDSNKITFDPNGNLIKGNEVLHESFLNIQRLPKETINFIQENYEYWNIHKINK